MNRGKNNIIYAMVCLGAVLLALRLRLYIVALDEKNLISSGHILSVLIWAAAAVGLVLAAAAARGAKQVRISTAATPVAMLGDTIFAIAIGLSVYAMGAPFTLLEKGFTAAGYLCVPGLLFAAFCRYKGKPVPAWCFGVVCIFFALYLMTCYRAWSSNPQLQDYVFAMLTCVAVMMFAYQNTAAAVEYGNRRVWLFSGLLAVCYGIAAIYRAENGWLCGAGAMWALTALLGETGRTQEGA